jgi:hypothetical protein
MENNIKICVLGHMRSGKDTLAEIFNQEFGLTYKSSSMAAAEIFIFNVLKYKYKYKTLNECFEDRVNHRAEWHKLICDYNKNDKARLAKDILENSNCYVGMRDTEEINECIKQKLFDLIIWVDASERLPEEDKSSFNIDKSCTDIIIENNGDYETFRNKVIRLGKVIFKK